MTRECYYKRNWTPGPPPKRILDHTHQPYSYLSAMWKDAYSSTKMENDKCYLVGNKGKKYEISPYWYSILFNMNRQDYNMYHRWFRNEIHFSDEDCVWMMFKLPNNSLESMAEKQRLIKPFLSDLTSKQLSTYHDLCIGLKQVEIATNRNVSKNAVTKVKKALIKKLQKELLQNGILGGI